MDRLLASLAVVGLLALAVTGGASCSRNALQPARPDAANQPPVADAASDGSDGPTASDGSDGPAASDAKTAADARKHCQDDYCVECGGMCPGCPPLKGPLCGDGRRTGDEVCDDGNQQSGDGCPGDCRTIETGFSCRVPGKRCLAICGDGLVTGGETCDDGNTTGGDGCSSVCRMEPDLFSPVCGDGMVTPDEECDCGAAAAQLPETCWGYNADNAYGGCTTACQWGGFCGDGIVNGPEQCDRGRQNGKVDGPDGCTVGCTTPHYCGDGYVDTRLCEECDLADRNGVRLDRDGNPSDAPDAFVWCYTDCTLPPGKMPAP